MVMDTGFQTVFNVFREKYSDKFVMIPDVTMDLFIVRNMKTGLEARISKQMIVMCRTPKQAMELIEYAVKETMLDGRTMNYDKLDSAYTKYVRNKAKRGQIGSTTETFNEIFPQTTITSSTSNSVGTSAIFQYPVNEMQEAWNEYQKAKTMISDTRQRKLEKPSNVMPETKKRAITLEDA